MNIDMNITNPFETFSTWLSDAEKSEPNDSNAMALTTVASNGQPSTRMVLLKGHSKEGFIFYTNLESRKSNEIRDNARVSLLFHWKSLRRQIRIEGNAHGVDESVADAYFASRSRNSQIGAWASEQSRPLEERKIFEDRFKMFEEKFDGMDVPRPKYWSGFLVKPSQIEFWMDREFRLHERWLFQPDENGTWKRGMLYP